jgi:hypothetical protein
VFLPGNLPKGPALGGEFGGEWFQFGKKWRLANVILDFHLAWIALRRVFHHRF